MRQGYLWQIRKYGFRAVGRAQLSFFQMLIHGLHAAGLLGAVSMSELCSALLCVLLFLTEFQGNRRAGSKLPFASSMDRLKKSSFTAIPLCSRLGQKAAASLGHGGRARRCGPRAAMRAGGANSISRRAARRAGPAYCGAATKPRGRGGARRRSCSPAAAPGREASGDARPALSGTERLPASPGPAPPLPSRRQRGVCGTGTCPAEERRAARSRRDGGSRRVQHQSDVPLPAPQRGGDPPRR